MKLTPAEYVVHKFGGVRKTARAIGAAPSSVSKWKSRVSRDGKKGGVPDSFHGIILKEAKKQKINIKPVHLVMGFSK